MVLDIGSDYALLLVTDDLGVESVALYDLVEHREPEQEQ